MAEENKLNILIESGADFVLPFTWYDNNGNPYDLTGATIEAQLRETASSPDAYDFICTHNGAGGRITITLPNEITSDISFSYGVYDVFVTPAGGTRMRPLYGEVTVQDHVTKPHEGAFLYMIGITDYDSLPEQGITDRLYFCYDDRKIYRWNGTNYIATSIGNGIVRIELKEHVDVYTDIYTIIYDDGTTWDYTVTMKGVYSVEKIGSTGTPKTGVIDQYRMTFNDETYVDYYVTNGQAFDVKTSYDATQAYEYLDMVRVDGATYVAVQDVPANTAITNTSYWLKIFAPLAIGTVTTVSADTGASASIGGTADAPTLNLSIPRGVNGNEDLDDSKGDGDTDYVWSADKTWNSIANITGVEPITGWIKGYYIDLSGNTVDLTNPHSNSTYSYAVVPCKKGDVFIISGTGGNDSRVYAFIDSSNNALSKSGASVTLDKAQIVAPENASKLIINNKNKLGESYKGRLVDIGNNDINGRLKYLEGYTNNTYVYPKLFNGTASNTGNTYAVSTGNSSHLETEVTVGDTVTIKINKPLFAEGNYYKIGYVTFNNSGTTQENVSAVTCNELSVTITKFTVKYIAFSIYEYNSSDNTVTLRVDEFANDDVRLIIDHPTNPVKQIDKIEDLENVTGYKIHFPILRNGSVGNTGNANAVTAGDKSIDTIASRGYEVNPGDVVTIIINRPLDSGGVKYMVTYTTYTSSYSVVFHNDSGIDAPGGMYSIPIQSANEKYILFAIWEVNASNNLIPLRVTQFSKGDVVIVYQTSKFNILRYNQDVLPKVFASASYGYDNFLSNTYAQKVYSLLVTTDVHGSVGALRNAITFLNNVPSLDAGVCLGDMVASNFADDYDWYVSEVSKSFKPFYTLIGNHEVGTSTLVAETGTTAEVVTKFITPVEAKMGKSGLTVPYYSFTNSTYKLYFIVLYNYDEPVAPLADETHYLWRRGAECFQQDQIDWFIDELENVPEDYSLVIMRHSFPDANTRYDCNFSEVGASLRGNDAVLFNTVITSIVDAWIHKTTINTTFEPRNYTDYVDSISVNADFSERESSNFICYLVGHSHKDVVVHSTDYPDQLAIGFVCTSTAPVQYHNSDLPRAAGTKAMDAITVVSFDTANRLVNLVRVGANVTNRMVDRTMISIPY